MADVLAIFGFLLILGLAFPALLVAWWLLFPATVARARDRLDRSPWRCLLVGAGATLAVGLPIAVLIVVPFPPVTLVGLFLALLALAFAALGAAGLAALLGDRIADRSSGEMSPAGAFVRGAVALELAAVFPLVGWFVVIPLALLASHGAAVLAFMRPAPAAEPEGTAETASPASDAVAAGARTGS